MYLRSMERKTQQGSATLHLIWQRNMNTFCTPTKEEKDIVKLLQTKVLPTILECVTSDKKENM